MMVKSVEALEVLEKLLYNIVVAPKEEKYRRIKLTNDKINRTIVQSEGALDALQALSWVISPEDVQLLIAPTSVNFNMKDVRAPALRVWCKCLVCSFTGLLRTL